MSFGLCNAPATFQRLADNIFKDFKWKEVVVYLDDVIVMSKTFDDHIDRLQRVFDKIRDAGLTLQPSKCHFGLEKAKILGFEISESGILPNTDKDLDDVIVMSKTFDDHIDRLQRVFDKIRDAGLTLQPSKCHFGLEKAKVLGFEISESGILPNTDKVKAISEFPRPRKQKDIQKFLGLFLIHFNPEAETKLHIDASGDGIGAVLLQKQLKSSKFHPVSFLSRTLTKDEKKYTITELECLSAVWAVQRFRTYLWGLHHFTIITDHHSLCWLKSIGSKDHTSRLARWSLKLMEYNYTVEHKRGAYNNDADALSRYPCEAGTAMDQTETLDVPTNDADALSRYPCEAGTAMDQTETLDVPTFIATSYKEESDPEIQNLSMAVKDPFFGSSSLQRAAKNFTLINNVLYKRNVDASGESNLLVVPRSLRAEILFSYHNEPMAGHLGYARTLNKIQKRYFWYGLPKDVKKFVQSCQDCQARKGPTNVKPAGFLNPIPVGVPFQMIGIDLLGPFRRSSSGKTMIVVATDYATRWAEAKALPNGKAEAVAKFLLENVICRHGSPKQILSDRGAVFQSQLVTELLRIMGSNSSFTTSYKPSTNGLTERLNKTIADMLNDKICHLNNCFNTLFDVHAPVTTYKRSRLPCPWLTDNIRYLFSLRDKALTKYKKN
ncbi:Integrase zinc binding domain [Popillia japonica]|uniref:RNA-directed DNA polymerase n=1 Tax=Popillia japonica TaxID=7064 RepID=A0AAW1L9L6_POPJA